MPLNSSPSFIRKARLLRTSGTVIGFLPSARHHSDRAGRGISAAETRATASHRKHPEPTSACPPHFLASPELPAQGVQQSRSFEGLDPQPTKDRIHPRLKLPFARLFPLDHGKKHSRWHRRPSPVRDR